MDLALNETQQMLQTSAREFLSRECPYSLVRAMEEDGGGYSERLWHQMVVLWMMVLWMMLVVLSK